jgi:hypothetical protein
MHSRPDRTEAAEYYFRYIDLVPDGDICTTLEAQHSETLELLSGIRPERVDYRYETGKWSIREVVNHLSDTERIFAFRAFWFARGFQAPLPSIDQEIAARHAAADAREWGGLVTEFGAIRTSTLLFFRHLPPDAWLRSGIASEKRFTVRALAFLVAGHVAHHIGILRERYL